MKDKSTIKVINRIMEILLIKRDALTGMGFDSIAAGVTVAHTEIASLAITEFGIDIDDLGKHE